MPALKAKEALKMGFKERIRELIHLKCNGSSTIFADRIGISTSTIRKWNDELLPKGYILQRIYDEFQVDITWLLTGQGAPYLKNQGYGLRDPDADYAPVLNNSSGNITKEELALIKTLRFCGNEYTHRMFVAVTVHAQRIIDEKKIEKKEKLSAQHDLEVLSTAALK